MSQFDGESKTCRLRVYRVLLASGTTPSRQPPSRAEATSTAVVLPDQATSGSSFSAPAATSGAERSETLRDSFNEAAILACMSELGLDVERLLTDNVRSVPLFMTALENFSTSLLNVKRARTQYASLITRRTYQGSIIAKVTDDIEKGWKGVHSLLEKVSDIKYDLHSGSGGLLGQVQAGVEKCTVINSAVARMQSLVEKHNELWDRLRVRSSQMRLSCDASRLVQGYF